MVEGVEINIEEDSRNYSEERNDAKDFFIFIESNEFS